MTDAIRSIVIILAVIAFVVGAFFVASRLFGPRKAAASSVRNKPAKKPASPREPVLPQYTPVAPPVAPLPDPGAYAAHLPNAEYSRQLSARAPQPAPGRINYGNATCYVDAEQQTPPMLAPAGSPMMFGSFAGSEQSGVAMRLTIIDDNGAPAYFVDISEGDFPVTIGRGRSDAKGRSIVVNEPTVSFQHVRIEAKNGVLTVCDCCSTCGTVVTVNGSSLVLKSDKKDTRTELYADGFELNLGRMSVRAELLGSFSASMRTGCRISLSAYFNGSPVAQSAYCDSFTIGRQDAGLTLNDPQVSRTHALVTLTPDGQFILRDQNSTNGVYAATGELVSELRLQPGTAFVVGGTRVQVDSVERGIIPAPAAPEHPRTVYFDSTAFVRDPRYM